MVRPASRWTGTPDDSRSWTGTSTRSSPPHARDRSVPRWLHDTAEALAEIDRPDLALDWAKQATDHGNGHQSLQAAHYWCALLAEHQPDQMLTARWEVFDR